MLGQEPGGGGSTERMTKRDRGLGWAVSSAFLPSWEEGALGESGTKWDLWSSDCDGLGKAGREGDPAGVGDLGGTKLLPSGGSACLDDGIRCPGS